jgi:hypothetical protein
VTASAVVVARSLAFGSLDDGVWGAAWLPAGDEASIVSLGIADTAGTVDVSVEGHDASGDWRIVGPQTDLTLSPTGERYERPDDLGIAGFDQVCRVTGRFVLEGHEQPVSGLGWRSGITDGVALDRAGSFRQVAAWFEPEAGLALLSVRPRSARGQEADAVTATVLDPESVGQVLEPRLSTTYAGDGQPRLAGVELWIGDEEEQYPRRGTGEAVGETVAWSLDQLDLQAQLFRWHFGGRDGAGVYLLGSVR